MRKILESSGYILYRVAEDYGFVDRYSIAVNDLTRISDPARKIVMLAAECITGPDHSIHLHTGIPDLKEKGINDRVSVKDAILQLSKIYLTDVGERSIVADIPKKVRDLAELLGMEPNLFPISVLG